MVLRSTIGIIILSLLLLISVTIIGLVYGGVIPCSAAKKCPDPGCNIQKNVKGDLVQCPAGYTTDYLLGVNVAAACDKTSGRCDRCIGYSYPVKSPTGYSTWPNSKIALAGSDSSPKTDGNIAKYGAVYVTDAAPLSSICNSN